MFDLSKDIEFFFLKVFKFRRVAIFSLSYRYIVIFCVLLLYIKVIRPRLKVSNNLCMKVLPGALFDLCLCLLVVFFLQLPGTLSNPKPKKQKKVHPEKASLYFRKWNCLTFLENSYIFPIESFLCIFLKESFAYIFLYFRKRIPQKKIFIYQEEIEALKSFLCFRKCNFLRPNPKIQKINPEKKSLYFRKWNFLGLILKRFLYFRK